MTQAGYIIDNALLAAMHAMCTAVATTLGSSPGSLAFERDMFLKILLLADWQYTACLHEHHVNENLRYVNRKGCQYTMLGSNTF